MIRWALILGCSLFVGTVRADDAPKAESPKTQAAAETKVVEAGALKLTVPTAWKQQQPSSSLRLAQFALPAAEGDAEGGELVISGPFGGSREANITRWLGQFDGEGRVVKMSEGTCPQGEYVLVDITGTYQKPIGPPIARKSTPAPGFRMLGVMITVKDGQNGGNYFLKMPAPEKTTAAHEAGLRATIGADPSKEKPYEFPAN